MRTCAKYPSLSTSLSHCVKVCLHTSLGPALLREFATTQKKARHIHPYIVWYRYGSTNNFMSECVCVCCPGRRSSLKLLTNKWHFCKYVALVSLLPHVCATRVRATRCGTLMLPPPPCSPFLPACLPLPLVIFIAQHFSDTSRKTCGKIIVQHF